MGNLNTGTTEKISSPSYGIERNADPAPELFLNVLSPLLQNKVSASSNVVAAVQESNVSSIKSLIGFSTEDWLRARNQASEEKRQKQNWKSRVRQKEEVIQ